MIVSTDTIKSTIIDETYMLATFFRLPFLSSGRKAAVTRCALVTLVVNVDSRSVLS